MPSPAFAADAPDPTVLVAGSQYYAYTTGTTWGNNLGVLTSVSPTAGWHTITGKSYGSSALPDPPSWQKAGSETSPGVFFWGGSYVMFYDAADPSEGGHYCISVATSPTPQGPFGDSSSGPLVCQTGYGGSIDPSPFVTPAGQPWLVWKSNDGSSSQPAHIWSAPLDAAGTALAAPPVDILDQNTVSHPWETTVENPDMVLAGGTYYLFFSGGLWDSSGYAEGYAVCSGPAGPCTQPQEGPILSSYGDVAGPGGADVFRDLQGNWRIAYAAWTSGCTSYSCGGARQLYVGGLGFGTAPPPPAPPVVSSVSPSSGTLSGGGSVVVTGAGFTAATAVRFGSAPASFNVVSDTEITATPPQAQAGQVAVTVQGPNGSSGTSIGCNDAFDYGNAPSPVPSGSYVALPPERIADTRAGSGEPYAGQAIGACSTLQVQVGGKGGVPSSGALSSMLDVTAISSAAGGYLTVYPAGSARPLASDVSFGPGGIVPALVSVPLSTGSAQGEVAVYNGSSTPTNIVVDVEGYVTADAQAGAGLYDSSSPQRLCDTREGTGYTTPCTGKTPGPGQSLTVPVEGNGQFPSSGVAAVVLNVTAVDPTSGGFLTVYPTGMSPPMASNVNFRPGQIVANRVIVRVGQGGDVSVYSSGGNPGIVVDAEGYFSAPGGSGAMFHPLSPARICDTRPSSASGVSDQCTGHTLEPGGETLYVKVAGNGGVPSSGAVAVIANVTVTDTGSAGGGGSFLVAYPAFTSEPSSSDLNWQAGQTVANLAVLPLGSGYAAFTNNTGTADVIVDVVGWLG